MHRLPDKERRRTHVRPALATAPPLFRNPAGGRHRRSPPSPGSLTGRWFHQGGGYHVRWDSASVAAHARRPACHRERARRAAELSTSECQTGSRHCRAARHPTPARHDRRLLAAHTADRNGRRSSASPRFCRSPSANYSGRRGTQPHGSVSTHPSEAYLLGDRQRRVLDELIKGDGRRSESTGVPANTKQNHGRARAGPPQRTDRAAPLR